MDKALLIEEGHETEFVSFVGLQADDLKIIREQLYSFSYGDALTTLNHALGKHNSYAFIIVGLYYTFVNLKTDLPDFLQRMFNTYVSYGNQEKYTLETFTSRFEGLFQNDNPVLQQINTIAQSSVIHAELADIKVITEVRPIMKFGTVTEVIENKIYSYIRIILNDRGETDEILLSSDKETLHFIRKEIDRAIAVYTSTEDRYARFPTEPKKA